MKRVALISLLALSPWGALAAGRETAYEDRLLDAIHRQENSARHPYGVKDGRRHTEAEARAIARHTVRHAYADWLKQGDELKGILRSTPQPVPPSTFLDFLADRYCPPSDDATGNVNWKRNVRWIVEHS